ncbi:non-heme chloride peroxidase [Lactococcus cremoris]|uniref:Alpha/beta hydrolase n=1 Tax=Lactococcus lactis subsp. cremoris TaxID=1359 RepID=A0AAD1JXU2_LACLC|nr:alpha/beta hydrolase [Lactococcus cremoris]BBC76732.1 non-heme chloride peroxidase [Lactococcus cremoris]BCO02849.1 alpha/beta hydrolase [Lactococcus cremoris]BCO05701.1 alpha/beta hydrolase [Lactococcus cremoris]
MSFFTTNDLVNINFHDYGSSMNPPIILIGGYSSSEVTWFAQIEAFVNAGYRVITYDHRSHGDSQKVDYGLTLHRLAMDLKELIDHLQLKNVILIGHSMGTATIMAYEELFTDENVRAVITEDQAPTFFKSADWLNGQYGKTLTELSSFIDDFPKTRLTQKKLSDTVKRTLGHGMTPFDFKRFRPLLQNVILQDWRAQLTQEQKPHLFFSGGQSPIFPAIHAQAARELQKNPDSEFQIFEGCGHILHLEEIEKFNQAVIDFLYKIQKD